jgi:carbonic anhydrase/acetyltransferase-like protein (isoleucine patch superfamily)
MIQTFKNHRPFVHKDAFVHERAVLIGEVFIDEGSSVWPGAVLRGDVGMIKIGQNTSIQDGTIIHMTANYSSTIIGNNVTVGHGVILHGCIVEDNCLIGMGSIILDNATIKEWSFVAAASLVLGNKIVPANSFVCGSPAQVMRNVQEKERQVIKLSATHYRELASEYGNIN